MRDMQNSKSQRSEACTDAAQAARLLQDIFSGWKRHRSVSTLTTCENPIANRCTRMPNASHPGQSRAQAACQPGLCKLGSLWGRASLWKGPPAADLEAISTIQERGFAPSVGNQWSASLSVHTDHTLHDEKGSVQRHGWRLVAKAASSQALAVVRTTWKLVAGLETVSATPGKSSTLPCTVRILHVAIATSSPCGDATTSSWR